MTYQFRPAVREKCFTLTGFAGPSGSGKTYSALRFATGLAQGGKIAMIDTEARRGLHYADRFNYIYSELEAPFTPERYIEAIKAAEAAGASVIIVDSMSHEHEGPGGVLEMHENELTRMAGDDFRKREACKFAAWIKPKADHNRFVNTVLQVKAHLVFCFRAKEKLKLIKNDKGRMEPTPQGWQPICTDRLEYEMTALLMLPPNSRGIPDLTEGATKMQEQHAHIFQNDPQIGERAGAELAAWSAGAEPTNKDGKAGEPTLLQRAEESADKGMSALEAFWKGLSKPEQKSLAKDKDRLKDRASKASSSTPNAEQDAEGQEEETALQRGVRILSGLQKADDISDLRQTIADDLTGDDLASWNKACDDRLSAIGAAEDF